MGGGGGEAAKNSLMILEEEMLLQAENRAVAGRPQNFQAESTDQLFSSLWVDVRVIILNSMLPFSLHTERKHPVPGTESDAPRLYFQPYRCRSDYGHNDTMTGL